MGAGTGGTCGRVMGGTGGTCGRVMGGEGAKGFCGRVMGGGRCRRVNSSSAQA